MSLVALNASDTFLLQETLELLTSINVDASLVDTMWTFTDWLGCSLVIALKNDNVIVGRYDLINRQALFAKPEMPLLSLHSMEMRSLPMYEAVHKQLCNTPCVQRILDWLDTERDQLRTRLKFMDDLAEMLKKVI